MFKRFNKFNEFKKLEVFSVFGFQKLFNILKIVNFRMLKLPSPFGGRAGDGGCQKTYSK